MPRTTAPVSGVRAPTVSRAPSTFRAPYAALALSAAAFAIIAPATARAAFTTPESWTRGDAGTTVQHWDIFESPAAGPHAADATPITPFNPNGAAIVAVTDFTNAFFVPGSSNVYSPGGPLNVDITVPTDGLGAGQFTTILFQTRTQGTEVNYGNVRLTYNNGITNQTITPVVQGELSRIALGGFGGSMVDTGYKFHVPYSPTSVLIEFEATGPHMSLDALLVDTTTSSTGYATHNTVPEPATAGVLLLGGAAALLRRRRAM